ARASVIAATIRTLTKPCRDAKKLSAVILGTVNFDQSQQCSFPVLARTGSADEYWVSDAPLAMAGIAPLLNYLGSRSSYYLNSFFEIVETANDYLARAGGLDGFLQRLLSVSDKVSSSNTLSPASAYASLKSPQYEGLVGVPLFEP